MNRVLQFSLDVVGGDAEVRDRGDSSILSSRSVDSSSVRGTRNGGQRMKPIFVSQDVKASASVVWSIITDLEGSVDTISAIEKVEILSSDSEFGVGTTWRETRTMFGKKSTEEMTVTEVTEGESYVVIARPEGANYRTAMSILPTGETACVLSMEFGANPKGTMTRIMGATMGKMFASATKKAFQADLDDIAAAAEGS